MDRRHKRLAFSSQGNLALLAVTGLLAALIYALAFVVPAFLPAIYPHAKPDFYALYDPNSLVHFGVIFGFVALGLLYAAAYRLAGRLRGQSAWVLVIGGAVFFALILLFMFPYDAADLFDYIIHGRIWVVYGANPYIIPPDHYQQDLIYRYVAWTAERTPYGPVWTLLEGLASLIGRDSVVGNVIAYKLASGAFYFASLYVVAQILKRRDPSLALPGVLLLAWNPVVLYETFANGHNDIVVVFFILAAVWANQRRRYTLAILSLVAGTLVKFIPVLLIPAALVIALRDLPGWRPRLAYLVRTGFASLLLAALLYAPFWDGPQVLTVVNRASLFTASLPTILYQLLKSVLGASQADRLVALGALALTMLFALSQTLLAWRRSWRDRLAQIAFNILAFYLLFTILWFQQWYTLWLIGLAPVLRSREARNLGILFGFAALTKQLIVSPALAWPHYHFTDPTLSILLSLGVMAIPWLLAAFTLVSFLRRRPWRSANQTSLPVD